MRAIRTVAVLGVIAVASSCQEGPKFHPDGGGHGGTSATADGGLDAAGGAGTTAGSGGAPSDGHAGSGGVGSGGSTIGAGGVGGGSRPDGGSAGNAGSGAEAGNGTGAGESAGTGGLAGAGGVASGGAGPGGRAGTAGKPGSGGTGGSISTCQPNATQCASGNLQTCGANGQWGAATSCGAHRACTGPVGTAQCGCTTDPVCKSLGNTCSGTTALVSCAMDGNGCFYQASSMTCANGSCSGNTCCTNACTAVGVTQGSGCGMQSCQIGANGCLVWSMPMGSCAAPLVCERYGGPLCADPNWAEWPIPPDSPSGFIDNSDGTITDTVTKLMWQKAMGPGTYTQPAAVAYCPTTTTGGHNDWRLPSVIELFSIVDHSISTGPTINAIFGTTTADVFWTSTVTGTFARFVSFSSGAVGRNGLMAMSLVRCVR